MVRAPGASPARPRGGGGALRDAASGVAALGGRALQRPRSAERAGGGATGEGMRWDMDSAEVEAAMDADVVRAIEDAEFDSSPAGSDLEALNNFLGDVTAGLAPPFDPYAPEPADDVGGAGAAAAPADAGAGAGGTATGVKWDARERRETREARQEVRPALRAPRPAP